MKRWLLIWLCALILGCGNGAQHSLQISLQREQENLPRFRRFGGYTAFVEGWAIHPESIGGAMTREYRCQIKQVFSS